MKIIESNCQTGQVTERDMTPEEVAAAQATYAQWLQDVEAEAARVAALEREQP